MGQYLLGVPYWVLNTFLVGVPFNSFQFWIWYILVGSHTSLVIKLSLPLIRVQSSVLNCFLFGVPFAIIYYFSWVPHCLTATDWLFMVQYLFLVPSSANSSFWFGVIYYFNWIPFCFSNTDQLFIVQYMFWVPSFVLKCVLFGVPFNTFVSRVPYSFS